MMAMEKRLYYAVNGSGQGCVFTGLPVRNEHFKVWQGEMLGVFSAFVMQMEAEGFGLPALKWSDEPSLLTIKIDLG